LNFEVVKNLLAKELRLKISKIETQCTTIWRGYVTFRSDRFGLGTFRSDYEILQKF